MFRDIAAFELVLGMTTNFASAFVTERFLLGDLFHRSRNRSLFRNFSFLQFTAHRDNLVNHVTASRSIKLSHRTDSGSELTALFDLTIRLRLGITFHRVDLFDFRTNIFFAFANDVFGFGNVLTFADHSSESKSRFFQVRRSPTEDRHLLFLRSIGRTFDRDRFRRLALFQIFLRLAFFSSRSLSDRSRHHFFRSRSFRLCYSRRLFHDRDLLFDLITECLESRFDLSKLGGIQSRHRSIDRFQSFDAFHEHGLGESEDFVCSERSRIDRFDVAEQIVGKVVQSFLLTFGSFTEFVEIIANGVSQGVEELTDFGIRILNDVVDAFAAELADLTSIERGDVRDFDADRIRKLVAVIEDRKQTFRGTMFREESFRLFQSGNRIIDRFVLADDTADLVALHFKGNLTVLHVGEMDPEEPLADNFLRSRVLLGSKDALEIEVDSVTHNPIPLYKVKCFSLL